MNVGTIVEAPMIKIRLVGRGAAKRKPGTARPARRAAACWASSRNISSISCSVGDTFAFAGEVLRFEGLQDTEAFVTRTSDPEPMIPSYEGGKFPLSTHLAERVRAHAGRPAPVGARCPRRCASGSACRPSARPFPRPGEVLVETFPRGSRHFLVVYPFEGRLAHQTLGMLLTRRLDRLGAQAGRLRRQRLCAGRVGHGRPRRSWSARGRLDLGELFGEDMLGDDLDAWLAESSLMKRTFRICAVIAGLIERRHPGKIKSGRQVTISSDLIYDVLRKHDPRHILLEAAWADAATGLLDIGRLGDFLRRIKGRIRYQAARATSRRWRCRCCWRSARSWCMAAASPMHILREAADDLVREAMQRG